MTAQQFLRILRARWMLMLVTLVIVVGTTITVSLILPPKYTATATVVVDFKGVDPISGGLLPLLSMSGYMATQVDIIQSHNVARKAVDLLKLADNTAAKELYMNETQGRGNIRNWLTEFLLKYLKVEPSRESSVVNVSYTGNDPRFSSAVANAFVQSYINTNLQLKVEPARQMTSFFNEQIKTLKDNLEAAQARLSVYQQKTGIIATDERLDVENARLNELSTQLVVAQAQSYDNQSRQRQVQDVVARGEIPESLPDVQSNPVIQQLKANLTQLDAKLNEITGKVGTNHPLYQSTAAEIAGVKKRLDEEMRTIGRTVGNAASLAQKREDQIRAALAAQRNKVLDLKKQRDEVTFLLREAESAQRAYDAALGRMTQTRLESQTTQTNAMLLNEAVEPIEPSSPKILLNTVVSVILGLVVAVGFALLREVSDRIVRSEIDLTTALGVPVLGVLGPEKRGWRQGIGRAWPAVRAKGVRGSAR